MNKIQNIKYAIKHIIENSYNYFIIQRIFSFK